MLHEVGRNSQQDICISNSVKCAERIKFQRGNKSQYQPNDTMYQYQGNNSLHHLSDATILHRRQQKARTKSASSAMAERANDLKTHEIDLKVDSRSKPNEAFLNRIYDLLKEQDQEEGFFHKICNGESHESCQAEICKLEEKLTEQNSRLMIFFEIEAQRRVEIDQLKRGIKALQQDLLRLMSIVDVHIQVPMNQLAHYNSTGEQRNMAYEAQAAKFAFYQNQLQYLQMQHYPGQESDSIYHQMNTLQRDEYPGSTFLSASAPSRGENDPRPMQNDLGDSSSTKLFNSEHTVLPTTSLSPPSKRLKTSGKLNGKRAWTPEEDQALARAVETAGATDWSAISHLLHGRCGKQCRERWVNHLCPSVNKEAWTEQEDAIIFQTRDKIGNHWADIARLLPGRTGNAVKNRYYSTMRRRMRQERNAKRLNRAEIETSDCVSHEHLCRDCHSSPSSPASFDEIPSDSVNSANASQL